MQGNIFCPQASSLTVMLVAIVRMARPQDFIRDWAAVAATNDSHVINAVLDANDEVAVERE